MQFSKTKLKVPRLISLFSLMETKLSVILIHTHVAGVISLMLCLLDLQSLMAWGVTIVWNQLCIVYKLRYNVGYN